MPKTAPSILFDHHQLANWVLNLFNSLPEHVQVKNWTAIQLQQYGSWTCSRQYCTLPEHALVLQYRSGRSRSAAILFLNRCMFTSNTIREPEDTYVLYIHNTMPKLTIVQLRSSGFISACIGVCTTEISLQLKHLSCYYSTNAMYVHDNAVEFSWVSPKYA